MKKWTRFIHQPVLPMGEDGRRVTGSKEHISLSRYAAAQGMVLLKNEERLLPLKRGSRVALFGKATADYVKGGGGSGDVIVAYVKSLLDGMEEKEAEGKVSLFAPLNDFYRENVKKQYAQGAQPGQTAEPQIPGELLAQAKAFTDTAVISICRFSGEGWDRSDADFYLTSEEIEMVNAVKENFQRVIVVLNVGGMVDTSWFKDEEGIQSVLLAWQGGMEGGTAEADILCGDQNPSGKLVDTFASCFEDYPSSAGFRNSEDYVIYNEDIYVGYRYFETIPGAAQKVNYCFGYGLSYTEFKTELLHAEETETELHFEVRVVNLGEYAGREVVQLYAGAPQGILGKPARELKAFAKTRELLPGESQQLRLTVKKEALASYDDLGKVQKSTWVLEAGTYHFYVGNSVRSAEDTGFLWNVSKNRITEQASEKCAPTMVEKRMLANGEMEALPSYKGIGEPLVRDSDAVLRAPGQRETPDYVPAWVPEGHEEDRLQFCDVANGTLELDQFMESLSDQELAGLLGGQPNTGVANTWGIGNLPQAGIPNVMTADGPAGLRIDRECGVYTTAWPCATLLACSFDEKLAEEVGSAGAKEVKENNIGVWLTPAMNIHRSPLCGRNFEYYSEDPLVAGKMGAAMVRGIQSEHIAASVKHFACNNKETNRTNSNSCVSERALREIYLKGFEIVVKEADPWTIMTSYNVVNGRRSSENEELLTGILRGEWGFQGMVTTDWWNWASHVKEVLAGNDVRMPIGQSKKLLQALADGELSRKDLEICAKRILEMILKLD